MFSDNVFERDLKKTTIQFRVSAKEKAIIKAMAEDSPEQDISSFMLRLIRQEYVRLKDEGILSVGAL